MIFTCAQYAIEEGDFLANYNQMPYAVCRHAEGFFVTPYAHLNTAEVEVFEVCRPSKKLSELYA